MGGVGIMGASAATILSSASEDLVVPKNKHLLRIQGQDESGNGVNGVAACSKEQGVILEQMSSRFWLKVFMSGKHKDVQPILERWSSQRKKAESLATAIRLWDAVERGDVDRVREIAPLLSAALGAGPVKRTRSSRSLLDLDSKRSKESEESKNAESSDGLSEAIADVTYLDLVVNRWAIRGAAKLLREGGYSAQDVRDWHERFWPRDWRAQKGEAPTLELLKKGIGLVRRKLL